MISGSMRLGVIEDSEFDNVIFHATSEVIFKVKISYLKVKFLNFA